ncbi:MAG: class I SAM-dependent methyltransferase [Anaerolineae bacterium]|nr:class I SAM-dependent methyltransferase [Candidatus Roseilinea sp.]MDW8448748.1 class I SAM-dependent methyltransferase [Anaerolineae bacterium]
MNAYTSMSYREIASRYNAINALPPHAALQAGGAIARYARGEALLDLGAGAGRLGIPAALAGCRVVALDRELAMLRAGQREASLQAVELPSVQADAVHLPLQDNSFDAVMINNLLHLVPQWEVVLVEAVRVMRPGGVLIQGRDWLDPQSCAGRMRAKWREVVATLRPQMRPTAAAGPALFQTLARMGGQIEAEILAAEWTECLSPARVLHRMRQRMHNETWSLDDDVLEAGLAVFEPWVRETFSDLHAEEDVTWRFMLTVTYELKRAG